jgi:hypothetical protein
LRQPKQYGIKQDNNCFQLYNLYLLTRKKQKTMKTYETGHAKNVANFQTLISFVTAYGEAYNPANEAVTLQVLDTLLKNAQTQIAEVDSAKNAWNLTAGARAAAFEPLKPTATRLMGALKVSGAPGKTIEEAKAINRKIQGSRAKKPTDAEKAVSVSQQSYDSLTENFAKFIDLLAAEPAYKPNEQDLKQTALAATLTGFREKNLAATNAYTAYSNAQIARNAVLYAKNTGLVDTALAVKEYVKSIFGATAPQYKQVSKLEFKRSKN